MMTRRALPRRRFLTLVLGMASVSVLVACGQASAPSTAPGPTSAAAAPTSVPAAPTSPPAAQPTQQPTAAPTANAAATPVPSGATVKEAGPVHLFWDTKDAQGTPWPNQMTKAFHDKFPNVTVDYRPVPYTKDENEAYPKMYAMYAAGTLGDTFNFDPAEWEFYRAIHLGLLHQIDEFIKADNYDLSQFSEPFMAIQRWEGKTWGLPCWSWSGYTGMFYNVVLAEKAGITIPSQDSPDWNMDTIYQHAVKLNKLDSSGKRVQYGIDLTTWPPGVSTIARAFNTDIISVDGKKATFLAPDTVKAMKWYVDLAQKEKAVPLTENFVDLMVSGKLGMHLGGAVEVFDLKKKISDPSLVKIKTLLLPKRPDGQIPSQLRGGSWDINAKSAHPAWAWEFLKHLSSREGLLSENIVGGEGCYARPDVLQDKYFQDPEFQVFAVGMLKAMTPIVPGNFRGTEFESSISQNVTALKLGQVGFDDGLKKLNDACQLVLDKPEQGG